MNIFTVTSSNLVTESTRRYGSPDLRNNKIIDLLQYFELFYFCIQSIKM